MATQISFQLRSTVALCVCLLLSSPAAGRAQGAGAAGYSAEPFSDGEYLRFKIKYGFIRLGTLELRQKRIDSLLTVVTLRANSTGGLPLITFHREFRSVMERSGSVTRDYRITRDGDAGAEFACTFDPETRIASMRGAALGGSGTKQLRLEGPFYDGVAFLMFVRCISARPGILSVCSIMDFKPARTRVFCPAFREEVEVAAAPHPLRARKIETRASWKDHAAAGMTGNLDIWVSDDGAAVPLRAEMQISVGSIRLELETYARAGWKPGAEDAAGGGR